MSAVAAIRPGERRRLRLPSAAVAVSAAFVALVAIAAVAGRWLAPTDPSRQDLTQPTAGPSAAHWLGTDDLGRDIWSRLLAGTGTAVLGPLAIALGALVIGTALGLLAGYVGGLVDAVISRLADLVFALPGVMIAIVVVGVLGGSYLTAVAVLTFLFVPADVRLVRSAVLAVREQPYLEAARTLGVRPVRLVLVHLLPNVAPTVVANVLLDFGYGLVALSSFSFLGLGIPPGTADWGLMIAENRSVLDLNPLACLAPAVLLTLTAVAVTILGDWTYDRFAGRTVRDE
jgi:ABC-type dipeptide/oligopeptide/nickel transport system permease subunit